MDFNTYLKKDKEDSKKISIAKKFASRFVHNVGIGLFTGGIVILVTSDKMNISIVLMLVGILFSCFDDK